MDEAVLEVLELEASRLRAGRRTYRRILLAYGLCIVLFLAYRMPVSDFTELVNHSSRATQAEFANISPRTHVAVYDKGKIIGSAPVGNRLELSNSSAPPSHESFSAWSRLGSRFPWPIVTFIGAISFLVLMGAIRMISVQKRAAGRLAKIDDVRAVGPVTKSLLVDDRYVRKVAERTLIQLLPRLQASDSELLADEHHTILNGTIAGKNVDLSLAVLKSFEQVGDHRDLLTVQSLADGRGTSRKDARIMLAAQECLPFVRMRAGQQAASRSLLRPAGPLTEASLLRPAHHSSAEGVEILLRSAQIDSKGTA